jgi:hypothetical protein
VATHVAHHDPHAVFGGHRLVQVAADGRAPVGGQLGRGDAQAVEPWRQGPQQHALGGAGDLAHLPELAQEGAPDVDDEPGADGEEHGTGDDPRAEPALLGERTGQLVRDRHTAPGRREPQGEETPGGCL